MHVFFNLTTRKPHSPLQVNRKYQNHYFRDKKYILMTIFKGAKEFNSNDDANCADQSGH